MASKTDYQIPVSLSNMCFRTRYSHTTRLWLMSQNWEEMSEDVKRRKVKWDRREVKRQVATQKWARARAGASRRRGANHHWSQTTQACCHSVSQNHDDRTTGFQERPRIWKERRRARKMCSSAEFKRAFCGCQPTLNVCTTYCTQCKIFYGFSSTVSLLLMHSPWFSPHLPDNLTRRPFPHASRGHFLPLRTSHVLRKLPRALACLGSIGAKEAQSRS